MRSRRIPRALGLALLALVALTPWAESAAAYPPFPVDATVSYEWTGRLEVVEHVTGAARQETAPWNPCGGIPPGHSLKYLPSSIPSLPGYYELVDAKGKSVSICGGPPTPLLPIPRNLSLLIGPNCKRLVQGRTVPLAPVATETLATPGTSTSEEVAFDTSRRYLALPGEAPTSLVCVTSSGTYTTPNRECAEFFDADLCAKETHDYRDVLGTTNFRLVATPTALCPAAAAARAKLAKRISRLPQGSMKRWIRQKRAKLSNRLRYRAYPRFVGECE